MVKRKNSKLKICLITLLLLSTILCAGTVFPMSTLAANSQIQLSGSDDPWGKKEVLDYLFWTVDDKLQQDVANLKSSLGLTDEQMESLKNIGLRESLTVKQNSTKQLAKADYNQSVDNIFAATDLNAKEILGDKYSQFRSWMNTWWKDEMTYRKAWLANKAESVKASSLQASMNGVSPASSAITSAFVFATQYNAFTNYEVALPDQYIKFANIADWADIPSTYRPYYSNPSYTVNLSGNGHLLANVLVREVGPGNINDNYWDSSTAANPRRKFKDLSTGEPEKDAAYYNGYNGGKDEFGYAITNPAGIDLSPGVASAYGLAVNQNVWLVVQFNSFP